MQSGGKPIAVSTDKVGEVGNRPGIQDRDSSWAQTARRNDIAGEGAIALRVHYLDDAFDEGIRAKQFAEISPPHLDGWYREQAIAPYGRAGLGKVIPDPFLAPVEEELALVSVEFPGNIHRTTEIVSKLVVVEGCHEPGQRVRIARPGIRVQGVVAQILVSGAVELLRSSLGDDADLSAGGAAVLRCVVRGEDLDFLCGIHVSGADAGAVRTSTGGRSAVKRDQVFGVAGAIEICRALGQKGIRVRQRAAARSRDQRG